MPDSPPKSILDNTAAAIRSHFGEDAAVSQLQRIPGQASNRRYFRISLTGGKAPPTAILVQLPEDTFASDEALGEESLSELPFCSMLKFLRRSGLPVPHLYGDHASHGFMLQEDLGETTMFKALKTASAAQFSGLYRQALDLLAQFQNSTTAGQIPEGTACIGYSRSFSAEVLRWELGHFKEWGLLNLAKATLSKAEERIVESAFDDIVDRLCKTSYRLAHRDFQSTNLMLPSPDRMVLIDFQDALMAPPVYDLVSLLRDSYVPIPPPLLDELLEYYFQQAASYLPVTDRADFLFLFHLQTVQRKLKDAGRFVFIDRVKNNPSFLRWVEPTLEYVRLALKRLPEYAELQRVLGDRIRELA